MVVLISSVSIVSKQFINNKKKESEEGMRVLNNRLNEELNDVTLFICSYL